MHAIEIVRSAGLRRILRASLMLSALFATLTLPVAAQTRTDVTGRVLDASTGRAIAAANIHTASAQAITDTQGRFRLIDAEIGAEVHVERLGYMPLVLTLSGATMEFSMEPAPVLLEAMVVEALGDVMLAHNSSLAVTRVDQDMIAATGATSLAESLDRAEGISLSRVGSWGSRPALRGLSGERLAVLVDGNRISRACTFGMDMGLATIDPATVERIEVLTGPGSTAYGSGNVGGVINVVTRRPPTDRPVSGEARAHASSAVPGGGMGGSLSVAGRSYAVRANLDGSGFSDYRTPERVVQTSGYRQLTGDVKLDLDPTPSQRISLGAQYYGARDIGWPMQGGAEIPEESRMSLAADYGWQRSRGLVDGISARAYFQKLDHHMVMSMTMPGMSGMPMTSTTDGQSHSETAGGRVQMRLAPAGQVDLDVGTEVTRIFAEGTRWIERQTGTMTPMRETFHTWPGVEVLDVGAYVQGDFAVTQAFGVTGGARLDRVDRRADQGDTKQEWVTTGNLGLRTEVTRWLAARATVGVGYRTPDPMELYGIALKPDGFVYRGRADLDTEKSLNAELTLTASRAGLGASVTGFTNHLTNMVLPAVVNDSVSGRPVREYQNLGEARLAGVSGTVHGDLPASFAVDAQATWTHGEDPATGTALPAIPPLEGGVALRRAFGESLRWAEVEWSGAYRQRRIAGSIGELATPGWGVLAARANAHVAGAEITFGVENVLDKLYRGHLDPYTLHRPGRNLFMRVSRSF